MKKRTILAVVMVAALVSGLMAAGCAKPAPAPAPAPKPMGEIPAVPAGEAYEWVMFSNSGPQQGWAPPVWEEIIIPDLENVTNGRLKIDILYPGEHPYKPADTLSALSEGVCQLLYANYQQIAPEEPMVTVVDLPFLQPPGGHTAKRDVHRLVAPFYEELLGSYGVSELLEHYNPPQQFWHVDRWLEDFESMKGSKIRTFSADMDNVVKMMNGIPIRIDPAEAYTALQTGLLDGLITGVPFAVTSKFTEVVNHFQPLDVFQVTLPIFINDAAWNELPTEIQDAVMAYFEVKKGWYADGEIRVEAELLEKAVKEYGLEIRPVPPEFRAELVALSYEGIWVPWAERVGEGAMDVLDMIVKTIEAAGYEVSGYPER